MLMCGDEETAFTFEEMETFWILVEILKVHFNDTDSSHVKILKAMYYKTFVQNIKESIKSYFILI